MEIKTLIGQSATSLRRFASQMSSTSPYLDGEYTSSLNQALYGEYSNKCSLIMSTAEVYNRWWNSDHIHGTIYPRLSTMKNGVPLTLKDGAIHMLEYKCTGKHSGGRTKDSTKAWANRQLYANIKVSTLR